MMKGVLFLAGYTSRSKAYAQAMANAGLQPEHTLLFGEEKGNAPGQVNVVPSVAKNTTQLFIPDLSIALKKNLDTHKWHYETIDVDHVNSSLINDYLLKISPRLVIYSGYGAQLVPGTLLNRGVPFLHLHSGWLPEYRGSTTLYYSWLNENSCAVSAILLDEKIDTGPIVERKKYPPPLKGIDPDHIYDPAIRADLLVTVLKDYTHNGKFAEVLPQPEKGTVHYVIHPVLKHLARLREE